MKTSYGILTMLLVVSVLPALAQTQTATPQSMPTQQAAPAKKTGRSPGGDIGSGTGDVGKGVGKGAGSAAAGAGKGAGDLVTLHPVNAAGNVGKGAGVAGKDVAVGTAKGTGKVVKGTGRAIKHVF